MVKKNVKGLGLVSLVADISLKSDDEVLDEIFSVVDSAGLDPENFLYTPFDFDNLDCFKKLGVKNKDEDYFFAYSCNNLKNDHDVLRQFVKAFSLSYCPAVVLHFKDKCVNIQDVFPQKRLNELFVVDEIGNIAYFYTAKDGELKDTYAGRIEIKQNDCDF